MAMARSDDFKTPLCAAVVCACVSSRRATHRRRPKKFGCTLIFPKSDTRELEKIVAEGDPSEEWEQAGIERAKKGLIKSPFLAGDGKEAHNKTSGELHPGMGPDVVLHPRRRPTRTVRRASGIATRTTRRTEDVVYSGCLRQGDLELLRVAQRAERRRCVVRHRRLPEAPGRRTSRRLWRHRPREVERDRGRRRTGAGDQRQGCGRPVRRLISRAAWGDASSCAGPTGKHAH